MTILSAEWQQYLAEVIDTPHLVNAHHLFTRWMAGELTAIDNMYQGYALKFYDIQNDTFIDINAKIEQLSQMAVHIATNRKDLEPVDIQHRVDGINHIIQAVKFLRDSV